MKIGYRQGAQGTDVGRLHRLLRHQGLSLDGGEISREEFGPSTLDALHAFQRQRGLPVVDEIDSTTLEVLLQIEQNITININEAATSAPAPKPNPQEGQVTGALVDGDGGPLPGTRIVAFAQQLRSESQLGEAKTNATGAYTIPYPRPAAVNLFVCAYDGSGKVSATSATVFAAAAHVQINLTTAKDGVVRALSVFTALQSKVTAQLHGTPLADLKENETTHEITFVANAIGATFANVAYLFMAHVLGAKNALRDETLFGIFYERIPPRSVPRSPACPTPASTTPSWRRR
jgi:peptidoglycan hydrolase-like protein with peptidoglycan-binding domain